MVVTEKPLRSAQRVTMRLGAQVTGLCSTKDVERVEALGADEVIDRKTSDPFAARSAYDLLFDSRNQINVACLVQERDRRDHDTHHHTDPYLT